MQTHIQRCVNSRFQLFGSLQQLTAFAPFFLKRFWLFCASGGLVLGLKVKQHRRQPSMV
jgi:hypothetical protein